MNLFSTCVIKKEELENKMYYITKIDSSISKSVKELPKHKCIVGGNNMYSSKFLDKTEYNIDVLENKENFFIKLTYNYELL